ncbi:MAG: preprotein translocase subunit SecG [Verrucomicrobiia bacterium]
MGFIVGILTVLLVLNSLLLILLVLVQLPKKDAGAGMAFGGGAADALFGAGSGNVLTKITKWATVIFFGLALFLGYLQDQLHKKSSASEFEKQVQQKQMGTPITPPPSLTAAAPLATAGTNNLLSVPLTTPGNVPTNPPAATPQSK